MQPGHHRNQSCTYTTTCDGVISSVGNTSLPAKHAHFSEMSGGHSARASWGAADAAALCWRSSLLGSRFGCDQKLWHRSPGRTAAREQPRALHCSHCLFRISISARPGRPMSWRLVEPDCAPPLGPPAAGPRRRPAALRRLQAARWRARRRARPPHARSLKTPSAAVPGTAHDLLFSFTKKAKLRGGGRGGGREREKKKRKNIAPRNGCCDRDRPQRRAVGGEGSEGDWTPGGHALATPPSQGTPRRSSAALCAPSLLPWEPRMVARN